MMQCWPAFHPRKLDFLHGVLSDIQKHSRFRVNTVFLDTIKQDDSGICEQLFNMLFSTKVTHKINIKAYFDNYVYIVVSFIFFVELGIL